MRVRVKGLSGDLPLQAFVAARMQTALQRARGQAGAATVAFTDVNGPKRGAAIRCAMVVGLSRRGTLRVSEVATTHELAFDQGVTTVMRRLSEGQNRKRVLARRPKKYYVAKRLRASRHSTTPPEMAGARVRPARRLARAGEPV